jgi:hypothetical protein
VLEMFRNDRFIFDNDFFFDERAGSDDYYNGGGELTMVRPGNNIRETNFIPDLGALELTEWSARGAGSRNLILLMAKSSMHAHVSEVQAGTYKKAHRHPAGRQVFTVTGKGYSLLWFEGDRDFTRVEWHPGIELSPRRPRRLWLA